MIIGAVQRLMHVADEVDQEAQRLRADGLRKLMVGDNAGVLRDLSDDAVSVAALNPFAVTSMFT